VAAMGDIEREKQNKTKTIRNRCGCVSRTRGRQRLPLEKEKLGERKVMFLTNSTLKHHATTTAPIKTTLPLWPCFVT